MYKSEILNLMSAAIKKHHFYTLWKHYPAYSREDFRNCCNKVRESTGIEPLSRSKFDEGWQWRTVLHPDYKIARNEFLNLCFGWW